VFSSGTRSFVSSLNRKHGAACPGFLGRECLNRKVLNPWWAYELCAGCATSIVDAVSKKSGNGGVTDLGDSERCVPRDNFPGPVDGFPVPVSVARYALDANRDVVDAVPTTDTVPSVDKRNAVYVRSAQSDVLDEGLCRRP